jgi:hypothetical protein
MGSHPGGHLLPASSGVYEDGLTLALELTPDVFCPLALARAAATCRVARQLALREAQARLMHALEFTPAHLEQVGSTSDVAFGLAEGMLTHLTGCVWWTWRSSVCRLGCSRDSPLCKRCKVLWWPSRRLRCAAGMLYTRSFTARDSPRTRGARSILLWSVPGCEVKLVRPCWDALAMMHGCEMCMSAYQGGSGARTAGGKAARGGCHRRGGGGGVA